MQPASCAAMHSPQARCWMARVETGMPAMAGAARATAAAAVHEVMNRGHSLDAVLDDALARLAPARRERNAFIQELTFGTVRWAFQLTQVLSLLLERPLHRKDKDVEALLLVGLYQLIHLRTPPHAAVAETVAATTRLQKPWARGLINAVLRQFLRSEAALRARIENDPDLAFSHPPQYLRRLQQAWPQRWQEICTHNNARPPLTLRVNCLRNTRSDYLADLARHEITAHAVVQLDCGIALERTLPVALLPGFAQGRVSVQDGAAQLAAVLLDAQAGEQVLDACAAPGGKAAHILERTPAVRLTAVDINEKRLDRLHENLRRLGLRARVLVGDAAQPASWWDGLAYDRILLDAPCSGAGVIRRHPDIKLHRTEADMAKLRGLQARLLDGLWPLLRPGGKLLYVTCSIFPDENGDQITAFMARTGDAAVASLSLPCGQPDKTGWQILPGECDMDGFYFSCLQKNRSGV